MLRKKMSSECNRFPEIYICIREAYYCPDDNLDQKKISDIKRPRKS